MVRVKLWGSLRRLADGQKNVEVDAQNFKQILDTLGKKYPALQTEIDAGVSIALDGEIIRDAWFKLVTEDNEVVLLPLMEGG
jgi:molybdopterin synthase sulfur carrier subunit